MIASVTEQQSQSHNAIPSGNEVANENATNDAPKNVNGSSNNQFTNGHANSNDAHEFDKFKVLKHFYIVYAIKQIKNNTG